MSTLTLRTTKGSELSWAEVDANFTALQTDIASVTQYLGASVFSVKAYGAVGNSVTDDTAAIQAAIDACETAGKGVVYFPEAAYLINGTITVSQSYIVLRGESEHTTFLIKGDLDGTMIQFLSADTSAYSFAGGVENMMLMTAASSVHTAGAFIEATSWSRLKLQNLYLQNPYVGIKLASCTSVFLTNVDSAVNAAIAFQGDRHLHFTGDTSYARDDCSNTHLTDVTCRGPADAFLIDYGAYIECADGIWISNCYFGSAKVANIRTNPKSNSYQLTGLRIVNTWFDQQGTNGIGLYFTGHSTAQYGIIQVAECQFNGGGGALSAIRFSTTAGQPIENVSIRGCSIKSYDSHGIHAVAHGSGGVTAQFLKIENNFIQDCCISTGSGITLASCRHFQVNGNFSGYNFTGTYADPPSDSNAAVGINIVSSCDSYTVVGNFLRGNTTSGITDSGGPNKMIAGNLSPRTMIVTEIASASSVTIPTDGDMFRITGTTNITSLSVDANTQPGRVVRLIFSDVLTVSDGGGNLKLAGDFTSSADDVLTLVWDGADFVETGRSAN